MPRHLVAAVCVLLSALVTPDRADAQHTPTACWKVSRQFHEPESARNGLDLAKRVRIQSVPLADPPAKTLSPNGSYWFAEERPDTSRAGPWTTRVLIFDERRTLVQLSFVDHAGHVQVSWVNEKLLFVRAWWGRIVATDLIFDVEKGRFVYREVLEDGFIAFQQWGGGARLAVRAAARAVLEVAG